MPSDASSGCASSDGRVSGTATSWSVLLSDAFPGSASSVCCVSDAASEPCTSGTSACSVVRTLRSDAGVESIAGADAIVGSDLGKWRVASVTTGSRTCLGKGATED